MYKKEQDSVKITCGGCGCNTLGTIIAVILSWSTWHSVLWAIINGLFSWFYVIYWLVFYSS